MTPARAPGRAASALLFAAAMLLAGPALAQEPPSSGAPELPSWEISPFDGRYPARLLTVETARLLDGGRGHVGFGDTRYALLDRRLELLTNTIADVLGIGNLGAKLALAGSQDGAFALAVGGKAYHAYGGLIDAGVQRIAESFATVTDSEVEVSGVVGFATATWGGDEDRTHLHASLQAHQPFRTVFGVEDSVAGGGGSVEFEEGDDVSAMWAVDHQLVGRLLLLLEAGYSWGVERPRFGAGLDLGGERWRVLLGASYPGVVTDLATEPRDFVVSPALSVHYRF